MRIHYPKLRNMTHSLSLRKFLRDLRDDSVISVNIYSKSFFFSFFLIIYKKHFNHLKKYIDWINVWDKLTFMTFEINNYMH